MFAKTKVNPLKTLTGRLTITYAILSGILSGVIILLMYLTLFQIFYEQYDEIMSIYANEIDKIYRNKGIEALQKELQTDDGSQIEGFIKIITDKGTILANSDISYWKNLPKEKDISQQLGQSPRIFKTIKWHEKGTNVRVLLQTTQDHQFIYVGFQLPDEIILRSFADISIITFFIMLICGGAIGWYLAGKATAGIKKVTQTAANIANGQMEDRVPTGNHPEEIKQLADTFNQMIDRIHHLLNEVKDVTNVIAHDLRSPLTRIRGNVEVTLRGDSSIDDYQATSEKVIEDCEHLESVINTMLEIASLDAGINKLKKDEVNLNTVILDAIDLFEPLAETKHLNLVYKPTDQEVSIITDRSKLQRSIANILDNAIKYTPENGQIEINLQQTSTSIKLEIKDSGIGISESDLPHVFQPFYRCDRSRNKPGNGLGLSYVQSIVKILGGNIDINSPISGGTVVELVFPVHKS